MGKTILQKKVGIIILAKSTLLASFLPAGNFANFSNQAKRPTFFIWKKESMTDVFLETRDDDDDANVLHVLNILWKKLFCSIDCLSSSKAF